MPTTRSKKSAHQAASGGASSRRHQVFLCPPPAFVLAEKCAHQAAGGPKNVSVAASSVRSSEILVHRDTEIAAPCAGIGIPFTARRRRATRTRRNGCRGDGTAAASIDEPAINPNRPAGIPSTATPRAMMVLAVPESVVLC